MAVTEVPLARPTRQRSFRWIYGILTGMALTLAVIGLAAWSLAGWSIYELAGIFRGRPAHVRVDQPTVVRQVRALQRLETASYTLDKVLTGEHENPILPEILAGDRLLLVAHGEVIAGVDLAKLQPNDVIVRGRSVSIHLPPAEIFTASLDNAKTRVYSRDTGLFTPADPELEGQVREAAVDQMRAAALDDGILQTAATNARQTIKSLLTSLGFTNIEIRP